MAEYRCRSRKAMAARRWLYENNLTYRRFYEFHRSVLVNYKSGHRKTLYEPTCSLLVGKGMEGLEVAAWPILYPWSRYGDSDVRARLAQGGSGTEKQHYSGKQSFIRKLLSRNRAYDHEPSLAFYLDDVLFARMLRSKFTVACRGGVVRHTCDIWNRAGRCRSSSIRVTCDTCGSKDVR